MKTLEVGDLLQRCIDAYVEAHGEALQTSPDTSLRAAVSGLLLHVAAEMIVIDQLAPNVSAIQIARVLIDAAKDGVG